MRDPGVDSRDAPASGLDTGAASGIDCPCCISMFGGPVAPKTSGFQSTLKVAILAALVLLLVLVPVAESKWLPSTSDHKEKWPCRNFRDDFNDHSTLIPVEDWDGDASTGPNFLSEYRPHTANVKDGVLILELFKGDQLNGYNRSEGMQTVVSWTRWWKTGKMCARMMTSRGNGTVTAVVAMSYNGSAAIDDEVDLEWTGRDQGIYLQTNWFGHERPVYGHGITDHRIGSDSSVNFHTYCFERTTEAISWEIDGAVVRRNTFAEWGDRGLPWRESKLVFNIWDGGQGDNGTAYWAGGPTDCM
jgi:beta-glucanase (GH16 family)